MSAVGSATVLVLACALPYLTGVSIASLMGAHLGPLRWFEVAGLAAVFVVGTLTLYVGVYGTLLAVGGGN